MGWVVFAQYLPYEKVLAGERSAQRVAWGPERSIPRSEEQDEGARVGHETSRDETADWVAETKWK
jgi:hypothetical protein